MMVRCVEAHTSRWNSGSCSLTDIVQKILSDSDRFYPHFDHVMALRGSGFEMCLGRLLIVFEPPHGKTNNLHMRKQRRRSASR